MARAFRPVLLTLLLLPASPALAQDRKAVPAPPRPSEGPEIVHGVYAEFDFGILDYIGGDAAKDNQAGVMAGFAVGADIGPYLKIEGRMLNATNDSTGATVDVNNPTPPNCPNGITATMGGNTCPVPVPDIQATLLSGGIKLVLPASDRLAWHAMADVGVMMGNPDPKQAMKFDAATQLNNPKSVASGTSAIFGAGVGVEYYTRLRHFSVGANIQGWGVSAGGAILTIYPSIKYTF